MKIDHTQFILEQAYPHVSAMRHGEITDCEGLFDTELWNIVPPDERRYVFGRHIAILVAQGKLPLRFIGYDSNRHNLYERI